MQSRRTAWLVAALVFVLQDARAATGVSWVLTYTGKSTNALVWDKRFGALVNDSLPKVLAERVRQDLSGPPDPVFVREHRYVALSACMEHSCGDKAFLWIDTRTGQALGAQAAVQYGPSRSPAGWPATVTLGSLTLSAANVPPEALQALRTWMSDNDMALQSIEFVGAGGSASPLDVAAYAPPARFHPREGEPSFDCARAGPGVESVICADPALARLDRDLAEQYERIRLGTDTAPGREELRNLQRQWLRDRNSRCGAAPHRAACLTDAYQRQHGVLDNWIPGRRPPP